MEQDNISLSHGIHRTPALGADGELSECVNLIPQAGELVNIQEPVPVGITLAEGQKLLLVHETSASRNYILTAGESEEAEQRRKAKRRQAKVYTEIHVTNGSSGFSFVIESGYNLAENGYKVFFTFEDGREYHSADYIGTLSGTIMASATEGVYSDTNQVVSAIIVSNEYGQVPTVVRITYYGSGGEEEEDEIHASDPTTVLYRVEGEETTTEILSAVIYSVTAMGNTLIFSTNEGLLYYVYSGSKGYVRIDDSSMSFRAQLRHTDGTYRTAGNVSEESLAEFLHDVGGKKAFLRSLSAVQSRDLFGWVDSMLTDESQFQLKYITPVIAAVELFDGSYVALSNIAYIGSDYYADGLQIKATRVTVEGSATSIWYLSSSSNSPLVTDYSFIAIDADFAGLEDIVRGVAIFTGTPFAPFYIDQIKTTEEEAISSTTIEWTIDYPRLSDDDFLKAVSSVTFYRNTFIPAEQVGKTRFVPLQKITGAEEALSLSDFGVKNYSAQIMYPYNNRLHLANYGQSVSGEKFSYISVVRVRPQSQSDSGGNFPEADVVFEENISEGTTSEFLYGKAKYVPNTTEIQQRYGIDFNAAHMWLAAEFSLRKTDAVFVVKTSNRSADEEYIFHTDNLAYPMQGIITLPMPNVSELSIYMRQEYEADGQTRYLFLHKHFTGFINALNGAYSICLATWMSARDYTYAVTSGTEIGTATATYSLNGNWDATDAESLYYKYLEMAIAYPRTTKPNQIIYTGDGNPFVLRHVVAVGNESILGLSTAAKALSQGQFGDFPLYVFCTDGIWGLSVTDTGTYSAKQPISRDVVTNPESITQLDSAVAFVTNRGLMLISGSEVSLLSAQLDGLNLNEDFIRTAINAFATQVGMESPYSPDEDQFTEQVQDALIVYDYAHRLLHVFTDREISREEYGNGNKHYVYSFDTQQWSTQVLDSPPCVVVPGYPYTTIQFGDKLYRYEKTSGLDSGGLPVMRVGYALTRPLALGDPLARKVLNDLRVVGQRTTAEMVRRVAVYVSNDNVEWHRLTSLRALSAKYYRFLVMSYMCDIETLSGIAIQYDYRYTHKMRGH